MSSHCVKKLQVHAPRLLACLLDINSCALGNLLTGKDKRIKLVMEEHKGTVFETLRTIVAGH